MWKAAELPAACRRPLPQVALLLLALLAGCATTGAPRTLLPAVEQEQLLAALAGFSLKGRALVQQEIASLDWQQQREDARVRLSGPFGAGAITVEFSPGHLSISARGQRFDDEEAEAVLLQEIGFLPPFEAMRYWVLGLAAPGELPTARSTSEEGRLGSLTQRGWHIRYEQWQAVAARGGAVQLPRRVTITRDDLRLRVVVDRWKL